MGAFRNYQPLLISFVSHVAFFVICFLLVQKMPLVQIAQEAPILIELDPVTQSFDSQNRVVDSLEGKKTNQPLKDAFLGEKNQIVQKQEVSITQFLQRPVAQLKNKQKAKRASMQTIPALSSLGVVMPQPGVQPSEEEQFEKVEEGSLASQAIGEYVKGFQTGEKTILNTREFVFYGYFKRIRESLDRAWDRSLKEKLTQYFYRGRQLASDSDYITKLLVTLDYDGQVIRVQLVGHSGTRDLDEAAIKAFNEAGPFPNPPKGLVGATGQIQVRWDFVLRT